MKIADFCSQFGGDVKSIDAVTQEWHVAEIDRMLQKLEADVVGNAVVIGDALHGDGISDQIPWELRDAFRELMHEKADSYNEMRRILADRIRGGDGEFLSFHDRRVQGFVSKLKGQIGENIFKRHAGEAARLADSGSQEGWDVVITQRDDAHEYVQVKLYANSDNVIRKMREVHEKVARGLIKGVDGQTVDRIDFAVPEDIADEVKEKIADRFPELIDMKIHTVGITAQAAAGIVQDGLSNVGPEAIEHLFDELLGGVRTAASLHALVNGFLWYKGAKDFSEAFADTVASTALTTAGVGIGLLTSILSSFQPVSIVAAVGGRAVLSRFARSRWDFAEFLEASIDASNVQISALQRLDCRDLEASRCPE